MNPAGRINQYLKAKKSPLAGHGAAFVREGRRYGIDPLLLVAISGAESSFGQKLNGSYNPFGWGPGIDFKSFDQAISTIARGLRKGYIDEGRKTISAIGAKWAPSGAANDPTNLNSNWARNVGRFYAELGGNGLAKPSRAVAPPVAAAQPGPSPLPAAPDFSQVALGNLAQIGAGKYDPVQALSDLTASVAAQPVDVASIPNFGGLAPAEPPVAPGPTNGWKPGLPVVGGSHGGEHGTSGLPGYSGVDYFGKPGSSAYAPVSGTVIKLSGHDPKLGAVQGAGGPLGWSVYIKAPDGSVHYLTHLGSRTVKVGQQVRGGQPIGTVADYDKYGRRSHVHYGVKR